MWKCKFFLNHVEYFFLYTTFLSSPLSGDSAVFVGERVPGACLLPSPHGAGGALPLAGPDDALSVGQHHWPREASSVSAGIRHRPQVCQHICLAVIDLSPASLLYSLGNKSQASTETDVTAMTYMLYDDWFERCYKHFVFRLWSFILMQ